MGCAGRRVRLVLVASSLFASALAAQESVDPVRARVLREAQRYLDCWTRNDLDCLRELTDRERMRAADMVVDPPIPRDSMMRTGEELVRIGVAEPWPTIAVDGSLFAFVPYFDGRWIDSSAIPYLAMGYLVGTSDDQGESWRFIQVSDRSALRSDAIDRIIPGYGDGPVPEVGGIYGAREAPLLESRWLRTTERRFVPVDEGIAYSLTYEIREELRGPIDFTVRYDNPVDSGRPLLFNGTLEQGQRVLEWRSPALRDFELGEEYAVVIEGNDPDTGARLFRHREQLLFLTTRDVWLSFVAPPAEQPRVR